MNAKIEQIKTQLRGYARFRIKAEDVAEWSTSKWMMYSECTIRGQRLRLEVNLNGEVRVTYNDRKDIPLYQGMSILDGVTAYNEELQ